MKGFLWFILGLVVLFALYIGVVLLIGTLTDYDDKTVTDLKIYRDPTDKPGKELSFIIWNIGYGGLGKEMDFFYDGGKKVFADRDQTMTYLGRIYKWIHKKENIDFFLLQEVDTASMRSHNINQFREIAHNLKGYACSFATNYNVLFVPVPLYRPMGKVLSGLATYSKFKPTEAKRYPFPGSFDWPKRVFMLDRCFLLYRYPMGGKDLVVINTHNSAFDDGSLKRQEMEYLRDFVLAEYQKGNYVIVGGDWNQVPPNWDPMTFNKEKELDDAFDPIPIPEDFLPQGWQWIYDPSKPTNRSLVKPYDPAKNLTNLIDFYLLSPNVEAVMVETIDLRFEWSDHQPVYLKARLK